MGVSLVGPGASTRSPSGLPVNWMGLSAAKGLTSCHPSCELLLTGRERSSDSRRTVAYAYSWRWACPPVAQDSEVRRVDRWLVISTKGLVTIYRGRWTRSWS